MKMGTVTGAVWSTRKAPSLMGQTFLVVATEQESIIAADYVGAGRGDRVLLITGSAASKYCMEAPVDAAVVAIMDGKEE